MKLNKFNVFLIGIITGIILSVIGVSGSIRLIDNQIENVKDVAKNLSLNNK